MRLGLALLIALHGAIHLVGLSRAKPPPALWLLATLVLLAAAVLLAARHGSWWVVALAGLLLSQALIVLAWREARFGTVANVLILLPVLVAAAEARFSRRVDEEMAAIVARARPGAVVEPADLEGLPPPVRAWLTRAGVVGRPRAGAVRLSQRGEIRTAPNAAWMPARAEQVFDAGDPAFVWKVEATMMGVVPIVGRDRYAGGKGEMRIEAGGLVTLVDAHDEKIAHGALLRFLGEIVWFPSAALSPLITWEEVDATHARATIRHAGLEASAVFAMSPMGRVLGLRAQRWLGGGADAKLTPWVVTCAAWRAFDGIDVPSRGDVSWETEGGAFSYYRWEILDLLEVAIAVEAKRDVELAADLGEDVGRAEVVAQARDAVPR